MYLNTRLLTFSNVLMRGSIGLLIGYLSLFHGGHLHGQEEPVDSIKARIQAVSQTAKRVNNATGYTELIEECEAILALGPKSNSHRNYLKKLLAWTLDKRGESRVELSAQFAKADSPQQANLVLQEAMTDFSRSIEHDPKRWQTRLHRASLLASQEDFEKAVMDYSTAIKLNPDSTTAWFNRAEIQYHLGKIQAAAADYTEVLERDPQDIQARSGRGHCRLANDQWLKALQDYDVVLQQAPRDAWAHANRADAYLAMQDWQKARDDLRKALDLQTNGEFFRRLAWLLATCPEESICDGDQALKMAQRAVEISGENKLTLDTLAASYAAAGDFDRARDVQARVIAMANSDDPVAAIKQAAYQNNERYQESFDQ